MLKFANRGVVAVRASGKDCGAGRRKKKKKNSSALDTHRISNNVTALRPLIRDKDVRGHMLSTCMGLMRISSKW